MQSIVVLENGAAWSTRVDHEAGTRSHGVVVAKQPRESINDFEIRVRLRLERLALGAGPTRGVFVLGRSSKSTLGARSIAARALVETIWRAGGGEVVIIGEDPPRLTAELDAFVQRLNQRKRGSSVSIRMQPESGARRVA